MNIIITEKTRRAVAYLSDGKKPIGTVFFLDVAWGCRKELTYAVTAQHCVNGIETDLQIEFNDQAGNNRVIRASQDRWDVSALTDAACMLLSDEESTGLLKIDQTRAWRSEVGLLGAGYEVYIIGLFSKSAYREGTESVEPIVRFGRVARPSTNAPVYFDSRDKGKDGKERIVPAILVECISFGGESGSPVFICEDHAVVNDPRLTGQRTGPRNTLLTDEQVPTSLLGLVSAHWEIGVPVTTSTRKKKLPAEVPLNSGIAVVIPIADILKLIVEDPNVDRRRKSIPKGPA